MNSSQNSKICLEMMSEHATQTPYEILISKRLAMAGKAVKGEVIPCPICGKTTKIYPAEALFEESQSSVKKQRRVGTRIKIGCEKCNIAFTVHHMYYTKENT